MVFEPPLTPACVRRCWDSPDPVPDIPRQWRPVTLRRNRKGHQDQLEEFRYGDRGCHSICARTQGSGAAQTPPNQLTPKITTQDMRVIAIVTGLSRGIGFSR